MLENININKQTVTAEMHAFMYNAIFGRSGVFEYGSSFECEIVSNNQINIKDGLAINQGRIARIPHGSSHTVTIENGTSGAHRIDLIVLHFETDGVTEIQEIRVLKGDNQGNYPNVIEGDTLNGSQINQMVLYGVYIDGLNIVDVFPCFEPIKTLDGILDELFSLGALESNIELRLKKSGKNTHTGTLTLENTIGSTDPQLILKSTGSWQPTLQFHNKNGENQGTIYFYEKNVPYVSTPNGVKAMLHRDNGYTKEEVDAKITYGTKLPETLADGYIFLLVK